MGGTFCSHMKKTYIAVGLVIAILLGVFISQSAAPAPQSQKGFSLGFIGILSGDYAAVGEGIRNGVLLASEQYNAAHPEAPITLSIEDDGFSGGKGMSAYQKLTTVNKVDALINTSTPTIDAIYETVSKTNLPVIQLGEQGREPADDNVFGVFPSSVASEYDYGVYLREHGTKEMAIVYTNNDAIIRFVNSFKQGFKGKTTDFVINADEKDFRTHALKVAGAKPAHVGMFMFPQQGAQLMKEFLKVAKNKPQFFFDANFQSGYSDYQRIMGDLSVLDGTLIGTIDSATSDAFRQAYKQRFGTDAPFLSDMGYDAFGLMVASYSTNRTQWVKNIKSANYLGVSGGIQFDEAGNRKPKTKMMVLEGGKISELK